MYVCMLSDLLQCLVQSTGDIRNDVDFATLFQKARTAEGDVYLVFKDAERARALADEKMSAGQALRC